MLLSGIIWVLTTIVLILFVGKFWWFPAAISDLGADYDRHFQTTLWVTGTIFVLAQAALGWAILRFRDRGGQASPTRGNNRLEALWTSVTAILFIGAVLLSTRIWAGVHLAPPPRDGMKIEVHAKQFAWRFRYPGPDGKFGHTRIELINDAGGNPVGLDDTDPAAKDDVVSAVLRVPVQTPILLVMHSQDVIHSFFVRELRIKQDVVPGMEIPLWFRASRTGTYEIPCAELCGLGHHQMRSVLEVVPAAEFRQWLREQQAQQ